MATVNDLIQSIEQRLAPLAARYRSRALPCDLFEAYIFALAVEAARNEGGTVTLRKHPASSSAGVVFRTSPGAIYSTTHSYTYATVQFPGPVPELEIHLGVYVSGRSNVAHECDVVILESQEADTARRGGHPRCSKVVASAECKYYTTPLGLSLGRSFLGLSAELNYGFCSLISNTSAPSVAKVLTAHGKHWQLELEPNSRIENRFRSRLEDCFKEYKVR